MPGFARVEGMFGASAAAWQPSSVAGLTLWVEGDGQGNLRGTPSGGTSTGGLQAGHAAILAGAPGDAVFAARWDDASGGARHVAQATTALQLGYNPAAFNGYGAMVGNGPVSQRYLAGSALSNFHPGTAWTVAVVVRFADIHNGAATAYHNDAVVADDNGWWGLHAKDDLDATYTIYGYNWDTAARTVGLDVALNTPYVVLWWYDGTTMSLSLNGGTAATTASGATGDLTHGLGVGHGYTVQTFATDGDIGAVVIYDRDIGATARGQLLAYLTGKIS